MNRTLKSVFGMALVSAALVVGGAGAAGAAGSVAATDGTCPATETCFWGDTDYVTNPNNDPNSRTWYKQYLANFGGWNDTTTSIANNGTTNSYVYLDADYGYRLFIQPGQTSDRDLRQTGHSDMISSGCYVYFCKVK